MAKKKAAKKNGTKSSGAKSKKSNKKNSLVNNINKRKKAGKSRPKKNSTVAPEAYKDMEQGWPSKKKATKKKVARKKRAKKGD